ncbi:MAG: RNA polymerase sigma factor [Phycisphaerales bacterium]|nr:RNA polymerase sigma factor [Phycisphaerales bacterium]
MSDPTCPEPDLPRLLASAAGGDEQAWRVLLGLYSRRVYAMAKSRCRKDDVAEEITQSVFCTVAAKLKSGDYTEQGRFESWLFRVTMNRVRDEARRLRRHAEPTDPSNFDGWVQSPAEDAAEPHDRGTLDGLRRAMQGLNDADREVVELRHHGGLSFKSIAELIGEPLGTVLARHHRALRKLKEEMERGDGAEGRGTDSTGEIRRTVR